MFKSTPGIVPVVSMVFGVLCSSHAFADPVVSCYEQAQQVNSGYSVEVKLGTTTVV